LPAARIFAYEPGSAARDWLAEGVAANGLSRVTTEALGLGAEPSQAFLTAVGSPDRHGAWNHIDATDGEPVRITTLDTELDRHKIAWLDLWKLDMEGYEIHAVRGAARALAAGRIRAIYAEAGISGRETAAYLTAFGYSVWGILGNGRLGPWRDASQWDNVLFLAPGHPAIPR
jgi:FkbM family methyltransferase